MTDDQASDRLLDARAAIRESIHDQGALTDAYTVHEAIALSLLSIAESLDTLAQHLTQDDTP